MARRRLQVQQNKQKPDIIGYVMRFVEILQSMSTWIVEYNLVLFNFRWCADTPRGTLEFGHDARVCRLGKRGEKRTSLCMQAYILL